MKRKPDIYFKKRELIRLCGCNSEWSEEKERKKILKEYIEEKITSSNICKKCYYFPWWLTKKQCEKWLVQIIIKKCFSEKESK